MAYKVEDLSNRNFGQWTVISRSGSLAGVSTWLCKCSCGRESVITRTRLIDGRAIRCHPCAMKLIRSKINLVNEKFGKWTVISYAFTKNRSKHWNCICDCGKNQILQTRELRSGKSFGCRGCKHLRQMKTCFDQMWYRISARARNLDREINIDKQYVLDLFNLQKGKCALTGLDISIATGRDNFMHGKSTASLDRIDSSKGYIKGNVQWVHKYINRMKSNFSQKQFIELCTAVANYNKNI
jgi:hypothetical protein